MKFLLSSPLKSLPRSPAKEGPHSDPGDPASAGPDLVSPELVPILTLLSSQTHRRYHEGTFMLYSDLNGDGNPADREWREVYGILTGNQLAYWDAASLARFKDSPEQLFQTSSKPNYLNFTDAVFNAMKVLPAAKLQMENVLVVLTTLKNRYILQFKKLVHLQEWTVALRLARFEYLALQEAYTGALLSARGLRLSDIRTILAPKRFNHEDWVKIRYGSGMAWKRCYAVIEPSQTKKKLFTPGRVLLFESENTKKKGLVGIITSATLVSAVYPQLPFFIDKSTIMQLEGSVNFKPRSVKPSKKDEANSQETSLFLMPEQHSSVPGFDTLIRFLIPLYDAFGLYGRPQRLKADRTDPDSLVFGLPTLPHVHYLNLDDLQGVSSDQQFLSLDARAWKQSIKSVLLRKMAHGYDGCGSSRGFSGAVNSLNSPRLVGADSPRVASASTTFQRPPAQEIATRLASGPLPDLKEPLYVNNDLKISVLSEQQSRYGPSASYGSFEQYPPGRSVPPPSEGSREQLPTSTLKATQPGPINRNVNNLEVQTSNGARDSIQLADIYHKYSTIETPSDRYDDRNKILNGSAEEIDEEVLPSLMRRKSLMNGPYPTSEKHLIDSESDIAELDEEEELAGGNMSSSPARKVGEKNGMLAVPQSYDQRNLSYSSVQSPLTQYNEFNQQFSKSVERNTASRFQHNRFDSEDDESESDELGYSDNSSPPAVPLHGSSSPISPVGQAQQLPQIQQLLLLHSAKHHNAQPLTPSLGENFDIKPFTGYPTNTKQDISVQKSKGTRNFNQILESRGDNYNEPRDAQYHATAPKHSPREFGASNGVFSQTPLDDRRQTPPQSAQPHLRHQLPQNQATPQQTQKFYNTPPHLQQSNQSTNAQYRPQQPQFQQKQAQPQPGPYGQSQRKPDLFVQQSAALQVQPDPVPQREQLQYLNQHQQSRGPAPQPRYEQSRRAPQTSDKGVPRSAAGQMNYGQPQGNPGRPVQPGPPQQMPQIQPQGNPGRPVHAGPPQQMPHMQPQGGYPQHQAHVAPQQQPQMVSPHARPLHPGGVELQRQAHPYSSRVMSSEHAPGPNQAHAPSRQPMQQTSQMVPPRPLAQTLQSALSIRSYGEQQYQYQVQPNFQATQRPQQQFQAPMQWEGEQRPDPRMQKQQSDSGYMRQY